MEKEVKKLLIEYSEFHRCSMIKSYIQLKHNGYYSLQIKLYIDKYYLEVENNLLFGKNTYVGFKII